MVHKEILKTLLGEVANATNADSLAHEEFQSAMKDFQSGPPSPDCTDRMHRAFAEIAQTRRNLLNARVRLQQFQAYGFVPLDLK
jgi:hypothetical protein